MAYRRKAQRFVGLASDIYPFPYENTGVLWNTIGKDLPNVTNLLHFSLTLGGYVP